MRTKKAIAKAVAYVATVAWFGVADEGSPPGPPVPGPASLPGVEVLATDPTALTGASTAALTIV
ncbi:MAG: hypothetical protein N3G20_08540, partial [Verrucomicrobiae bacterium]|nr:hypothetical protein [Verrucomicrobiae bacterium]